MRTVFIIVGALLLAGSTVQAAAASEHHPRAARSNHHRAHGQVNQPFYPAPQAREGYTGGKPPADETRTCDRLWCYAD